LNVTDFGALDLVLVVAELSSEFRFGPKRDAGFESADTLLAFRRSVSVSARH
jgi:hypothetical protein